MNWVIPIWVTCEQGAVLQSLVQVCDCLLVLYLPVVMVIQAGGRFIPDRFWARNQPNYQSCYLLCIMNSRIPHEDLWPHPALLLAPTALAGLAVKGSTGMKCEPLSRWVSPVWAEMLHWYFYSSPGNPKCLCCTQLQPWVSLGITLQLFGHGEMNPWTCCHMVGGLSASSF